MAGPSVAAARGESGRAAGWARLLQGLRVAFYAAFAVAAGGAMLRALVAEPPPRVRRGIALFGLAGIAVATLSVGALGGLFAEAPWSGMLDAAVWRLGADAPPAASLGVSAIGLGLAAVSAGPDRPAVRRIVGGAGALVATLGFPLAGHAATAEPRWASAMALTIHAIVVSFWLGAFWPLRALLADRGAACALAVERFSRLAVPAVAALFAAGAAFAAPAFPRPARCWAAVTACSCSRRRAASPCCSPWRWSTGGA